MRSDLALKGNIDGVELLIFPSNQLPEKSQRKNCYSFPLQFSNQSASCEILASSNAIIMKKKTGSTVLYMHLVHRLCNY